MADITFIVPVAPHHQGLLGRALASIEAQTLRCDTFVIADADRRGAGWARNSGLLKVNTPYIVFLDADDEVLPEFAERTLQVAQPRRFVYTDWYDLDRYTHAPDCPFINNNRSVITTLIATEDARRVQGFDETLTGMEDTHFYLKLLSNGICGVHVREPLFRYHPDGRRSRAFVEDTDRFKATVQRFNAEFGSKPMAECGTCGGSPYAMPEVELLPIGEQQPGDVLARALWAGNLQMRGRLTGRLYPRTSVNGSPVWVSPRDIDGAPDKWTRVIDLPKSTVTAKNPDFQAFAHGVMQSMLGAPVQKPEPVYSVYGVQGDVKPNVGNLLKLYQQPN